MDPNVQSVRNLTAQERPTVKWMEAAHFKKLTELIQSKPDQQKVPSHWEQGVQRRGEEPTGEQTPAPHIPGAENQLEPPSEGEARNPSEGGSS